MEAMKEMPNLLLAKTSGFFSRRPNLRPPVVTTDTLDIRITQRSDIEEAIKALRSGIYDEATTKVHITKSTDKKFKSRLYSRLLAAISRIPNLQELSIKGELDAWQYNLPLPAGAIRKLLLLSSQTIRRIRLQNVSFVARKRGTSFGQTHPEAQALFDSMRQLKRLEEIEVTNCSLNFRYDGYVVSNGLKLRHLLLPLAPLPSLKKIAFSCYGYDPRDQDPARCILPPFFRSCLSLEELVLSGFPIDEAAWKDMVPNILQRKCLKKLHLDRCDLTSGCLEDFLGLLGPDSPLIDFEFKPCLSDEASNRWDSLGGFYHIDPSPWGATVDKDTPQLSWRRLLTEAIPDALRSNTRLRRLRIKAEGRVNMRVPVEIQQPWLGLVEGPGKSLNDFGFSRNDEYYFHYESEELAAKFELYQKLARYGFRELEVVGERDRSAIQILSNASEDVPCLFHILREHPSLCNG
ncbi:expressed unknown protein [Seminavis robusta]|uniref:Uncharacterized protein n=1 Tax=Seminavis robusta TaxID=568900 RepID=A0A9N8D715_9STRA|nr:expressed unknown protein [Seminavis robusta]|eukprot:Sro23_g016160.1 n/a (463) ;mRNA; r:166849-168237